MTSLSFTNITKRYEPGLAAVDDLTLNVADGELMVLLGPSGCGKTTTLRLVAGLTKPDSGDIFFDGRSILGTGPEKRAAVMVFQQDSLFPFMSVAENVAFGLKLQRLPEDVIDRRVEEALKAVYLPDFGSRHPEQLSGGQKQRVALARALAVHPKVLLLDEPLSQLDRELRRELRQLIRRIQKASSITTMMVTHDQIEAVDIADRIALIFDGRLRQVGQASDFYHQPVDAQTARFFGATNTLTGEKENGRIRTSIGVLDIGETRVEDGPVQASFRPEAVEFGAIGENTLSGYVLASRFQGQTFQFKVRVGDVEIDVVGPPYCRAREGETVAIFIPKERINVFSSCSENGGQR